MVSQKRLDCGFSGSGDPPVPRAARSVRRRSLVKSKRYVQQMHAFDLLATVAGDLLSDRKSSSPSVVDDCTSKEENSTDKPLDDKSCDQEFRERNFLCTELVSEAPDSNCCREEFPCAQNNAASRPTSLVFAEQLVDDCKLRLGICTPIVNVESSDLRTSVNCELKDENRNQIETDYINCRNLSNSKMAKVSNSGHVDASDKKSYPVVSSVDSVNHPLGRDHTPCGSYLVNRGSVKLVNRDDDENFCKYTESSTRNKVFRPSGYVGDSRIRKLPKVTSSVRDDDCFDAVTERCNYLNRKHNLKLQRSARDYPLKKRKLYDCSSVSNSVEGTKSDRVYSVPENSTNGGVSSSGPVLQGDALIRTPASAARGNTSFGSNHQVKLKIKSFRVPEMFLEFPESTTVGFLKKTVMEAVNAVFGGGLRVGVILQGEKIRDDNRTLLQTGISHDNKMETLGFTLEPNIAQTPIKFRADRPAHRLHDDPQPLARYPPTPGISWNAIQEKSLRTAQLEPPETNSNNYAESDRDSAPFPLDVSLKKTVLESKALVSVPSTEPDALVAVPFQKSKRSESAQRRIRRPFTVSEVEALVHAVEKLGTGRWRDVKLRAFDNAKHRTYVDLKDKWKTLVHTARISPQQRRGEPVPQELLDRVLAAHAYWSHHQAKHQLKSHPETCLLL